MEYDGSLEVMEQIDLDIRPTGSIGMRPLLELRCLRAIVKRSHGMEYGGSLEEEMEQINLRIHLTG
jgi:hypothetical protein